MIETFQFRLVDGADEDAFLAVDKRLQSDFTYQQPGIVRRTTARNDSGEWILINLWRSAADADAASRQFATDALAQEFVSFIDGATVRVTRYEALD